MHERLRRQLRAHFGREEDLPPEVAALAADVEATYLALEEARSRIEQTLEQSSRELLATNVEMRGILQELTQQRTFLRQVLDLTPHFIFAKDRAGRFTLVNRAVADAYGTSVEQLLGKTDADFNPHTSEVEQFRRDDLEVMDTGKDKLIPEEKITDAQGTVRWLETIKRAIPSPGGGNTQVLGVATDITERHRVEATLQARTEVLRTHQEALHQLALMDFSDWDAAMRGITETTSRVLGVGRVGVWIFREDRDEMVCRCLLVDGTFTPDPGLVVQAAEYPRYFQAIAESRTVAATDARTDPRTSEFTEEYLIPHDITSMMDVPIRLQGAVAGVVCHEQVGSIREWTPEEQTFAGSLAGFVSLALGAEKRRHLEAELRHAQKMEAIGHLAGGVAHDFNNLLTAMLGYCQLILDRMPMEDPNRSQVDLVKQAAGRAAKLTGQLLAFSRKQVLTPRVLDLNRVILEMEHMLRRLAGEQITVSTELAGDLGRVRADRGQLEQVLLNLAVNARDAMPARGRLTLTTANVLLSASTLRGHPGSAPGRYVRLAVADTGAGMDADTQARIFEPFFTTKEPGKGTGLGLSTVYGIVKQSGGHVAVESRRGEGSTFSIYLPLVQAELDRDPKPPVLDTSTRPRDGTEVVLLVEDEPHVRQLVRQVLELHRYQVIDAEEGAQAMLRSRAYAGRIHLLLTDVRMPGMNGRELYERLHRERQDLRVLYMSGNSEVTFHPDEGPSPGIAFIQKPFDPESLVLRIREILDGPAPETV